MQEKNLCSPGRRGWFLKKLWPRVKHKNLVLSTLCKKIEKLTCPRDLFLAVKKRRQLLRLTFQLLALRQSEYGCRLISLHWVCVNQKKLGRPRPSWDISVNGRKRSYILRAFGIGRVLETMKLLFALMDVYKISLVLDSTVNCQRNFKSPQCIPHSLRSFSRLLTCNQHSVGSFT